MPNEEGRNVNEVYEAQRKEDDGDWTDPRALLRRVLAYSPEPPSRGLLADIEAYLGVAESGTQAAGRPVVTDPPRDDREAARVLFRATEDSRDLRSVLTRVEAERDEKDAGLDQAVTMSNDLAAEVVLLEAQRDSLTTALRRIAQAVEDDGYASPALVAIRDVALAALSSLEDT